MLGKVEQEVGKTKMAGAGGQLVTWHLHSEGRESGGGGPGLEILKGHLQQPTPPSKAQLPKGSTKPHQTIMPVGDQVFEHVIPQGTFCFQTWAVSLS